MKPLDPRLLRYARASRRVFGFGAVLGVLRTLAIIAWCWCITQALAVLALPVLEPETGFLGRVAEYAGSRDQLPWFVSGALAAVIVRSVSSWGIDALAARGAVETKAQLRAAALDAVDARSPEWLAGRSDVETATVLGRGLDALDGYFSAYVPQLILAACATPILVLAVLIADPLSGIIVVIVFPLIPVFMILIGKATQAVQDRQWEQLRRLSESFLDVVTGLPTLKIFRRADRQAGRIKRESEEYRSRTMKVLRVTFLSGFVLDLAGTFSIALVAVTVGTRLVSGDFSLALGLFVLLLLPETFIPIRQVGAAFHASTEGIAASAQVFEIIEGDAASLGSEMSRKTDDTGVHYPNPVPSPTFVTRNAQPDAAIEVSELVIPRGSARIGPVSFQVRPGEVVALAGPSGAGKSTVIAALLGFATAERGALVTPRELAWAGQRPGLLQGTVLDNIALGGEHPDRELAARALAQVGLGELGVEARLGAGGSGVSGGQAQRIAIARALYRAHASEHAALLLDEPTSALDADTERRVMGAIRATAREEGHAVLVVSHRPAVLDGADRVVRLTAPDLSVPATAAGGDAA